MCKFCDFDDKGCGNILLAKEIDFGDFGLADMSIELWVPNILWLTLTPVNIDTELSTTKRINYCPMCGRKLADDGT